MDKRRIASIGLLMLAPGAAIFAWRAALALAGYEPSTVTNLVTAATGVLSLLGLFVFTYGVYGTDHTLHGILATFTVLVGHFVVSNWVPDLGAAMVYLGTALAAKTREDAAMLAGLIAAAGAVLRSQTDGGHFLVLVGAAVLALLLYAGFTDRNQVSE